MSFFLLLFTLPLTLSQLLVQHEQKLVAFCLTPKIGHSEVLDYLHWYELPKEVSCTLGITFVGQSSCRKAGIKAVHPLDRYTTEYSPPLRQWKYVPKWNATKIVVVYRDPWHRLLSGFDSKFVKVCSRQYDKFQKEYLPTIDIKNKTNGLEDFFKGIIKSEEKRIPLNGHFLLQSRGCLSDRLMTPVEEQGMEIINVDLKRSDDMNKISSLLGHYGKDSFSEVLKGAYVHNKIDCYDVRISVIGQILLFLQQDYDVIKQRINVTYSSQQELTDIVSSSSHSSIVRVCVHNKTTRVID